MMVREIAATQRELRRAGEDDLANTIGRKHG